MLMEYALRKTLSSPRKSLARSWQSQAAPVVLIAPEIRLSCQLFSDAFAHLRCPLA
jgi:hypothetical protein